MIAIWWHLYFGVVAISLVSGHRPSRRLMALLLVPPLFSVSALAWLASNPFNGTLLAIAAVWLSITAARLGGDRVTPAAWPFVVAGSVLFGFGWVYPHFSNVGAPAGYLYATPLGLIPCPSLSAIIGLSIALGGFGSVIWSTALGLVGAFYGFYGAAVLGVTIDWVLAAGGVCILLVPHFSGSITDLPD